MSAQSAYQEFVEKYQDTPGYENMIFADYFSLNETKEFITTGVEDNRSELMETELKIDIKGLLPKHNNDLFIKVKSSSSLRSFRIKQYCKDRDIPVTTVGHINQSILDCCNADGNKLGFQGNAKKISSLRSLRLRTTCLSTNLQEALGKKSTASMPISDTTDHASLPKSHKRPRQSSISSYFKAKQSGHSKSISHVIQPKRRKSSRQSTIESTLKSKASLRVKRLT